MNAKALEQFVHEAQGGRLSRRALMARAVALGIGGLGLQDAPPAAAAVSKKIAFKFAYTSTPTNPVSMGYEKFAAVVREKGAGEIDVSTYCCNQLGNDQELVQSVQYGALQMGASSWAAAGFVDTLLRCDDETGGGSWERDGSSAGSSRLRQ